MKIAVITKQNIQNIEDKTRIMRDLLNDGSFQLFECTPSDINSDFDRILVFGGDGTVLETVHNASKYQIPILGINLGNLGFLAKFEQHADTKKIIKALKSKRILNRFLLETQISYSDACTNYLALNEVVVKSVSTRPVYLNLKIDGVYVDTYHSDGIIISTPTGSTAYSLSAGGPVLSPKVDAVVINPVCPHSLHSRPLVINSDADIEIEITNDVDTALVVDGKLIGEINKNCNTIFIKKSKKSAKFIAINGNNFYKKLLEKMNRWGTTSH